ncbi:hypothetical protein Acr_17g0001370 [Actinidia rufa]|uniref:Uncharacterized protein n=1 Tax=Actinidia rufa TaxID=165716 RepID=A0A7J0G1B2_9ERIC|nr:hypothetical protein Acr_17g0001370 [Actinidia rufa]
MKLATKSRLRSPKESTVPGDSFRNHDLAGPFKVAENALHITSSEQPWSDIRLLYESSVSTVTGAPTPVLMASSRASKSRIFCEVDLSRALTWSPLRGLLPLLDRVGVLLDSEELFSRKEELGAWRLPERFEWRDRSTSGMSGAAGSGGWQQRGSCIRRPLFSFIILICSAISCTSRWRPSRSGAWAGLAIGWDLFPGGLLALGLGRPAQLNRNKGPGRGRSKPLRRGDQTKVMTADGVMGRVRGSRRDPRKDEYGKISRRYRRHKWKDRHLENRILVEMESLEVGILSTLPRPRARRRQYFGSGRSDEYLEGGSGELNGDDLARFHGLVLSRSGGFGDKTS